MVEHGGDEIEEVEFKIPVKQACEVDEQDVRFLRKKDGTEWIVASCGKGSHLTMVSAPQLYDWLKYHYNGVDRRA